MNNHFANEHDKAWLAGLFEGDGHIGICKKTYCKQGDDLCLQITVTNNEEDLLTPYLFYGGRIINPTKKWRALRWYLSSQKAADFLQLLLPYLKGRKKKQAELAIRFQSLTTKSKTRDKEKWWKKFLLSVEINCLNTPKTPEEIEHIHNVAKEERHLDKHPRQGYNPRQGYTPSIRECWHSHLTAKVSNKLPTT